MWILLGLLLFLVILILFEYRIRKPDQIILFEYKGKVTQRKGRFYPQHFSLAIPGTIHSKTLEIESEAKGKLLVSVRLSIGASASLKNLPELIRVGGWEKHTVENAVKELDNMMQAIVKEFSEKYEIEDISSDKLSQYLHEKIGKTIESLGLDIPSLHVQSVDPVDEKISEAMRQQESARILEQTEKEKQRARVASEKARIEADEQIAISEHDLEMKSHELKKVKEAKEAVLAKQRVEEELTRKNLQLEFDQKEVALLKNSPELLMLTPQIARLAEASQNLRNAKTVVSLSQNDVTQGSQIVGMLHSFLQNVIQNQTKNSKIEKK